MRTPEQAEQFKRDYLAQIDVNALNEVEKVLYAAAESRDLSNLPPMKLNKALEKLPMDSLEPSQLLQAGYHLPHLLPSWLSEMLSYLLAYRETKSDMRGLYRFRLSNSGELTPYAVREHVVAALMIALHGASLDDLVRNRHTIFHREFYYVDYSAFIAAAIRQGNADVIAATKEVFVSENNVGILSRELVCAVERTDNEALHDALIDLLKAAKLQEGLRQVIVESGDSYNTLIPQYFFL